MIEDLIGEYWKQSFLTEYEVSSFGRIRNVRTKRIRTIQSRARYLRLSYWDKPAKRWGYAYVHDLVAVAFLGDKPDGVTVDHVDGDSHNNGWRNIQYLYLDLNASKQAGGKLSPGMVQTIKRGLAEGQLGVHLARVYGVSPSMISKIRLGQRWKRISAADKAVLHKEVSDEAQF